jgi:uncharacterized protein with HEPN domain
LTTPRDFRDFLEDIVEAAPSLVEFVEGMTLDTYLADRKTRFAVMRGFEMMGEAVRHIPEAIKVADPDIPWAMMAAVRNRVVHGYFGIDDSILFTTIDEDVKPLLPQLIALALKHNRRK